MAITHTYTTTVKVPGLPSLPTDTPVAITGDYGVEIELTCPNGQTTSVTIGTLDRTKFASLVLNSDFNVTCNTNAANASGGQTVALAAKKSYYWHTGLDQTAFPMPISADISAFYIINAGASVATFRAGFALNS